MEILTKPERIYKLQLILLIFHYQFLMKRVFEFEWVHLFEKKKKGNEKNEEKIF